MGRGGGERGEVSERESVKKGWTGGVFDNRPRVVYNEKECCGLFYGSALFYRLLSVVCCYYSSGH